MPLGVRPERLLLEVPAGSLVVRVSIVDGAPGEPTTAQAVSTLNSLHVTGELQRKYRGVRMFSLADSREEMRDAIKARGEAIAQAKANNVATVRYPGGIAAYGHWCA